MSCSNGLYDKDERDRNKVRMLIEVEKIFIRFGCSGGNGAERGEERKEEFL